MVDWTSQYHTAGPFNDGRPPGSPAPVSLEGQDSLGGFGALLVGFAVWAWILFGFGAFWFKVAVAAVAVLAFVWLWATLRVVLAVAFLAYMSASLFGLL